MSPTASADLQNGCRVTTHTSEKWWSLSALC